MTTLHISSGLSLPLDTVTSTLIVYGGKGMGKTNLLAVTLEEMSSAGLRWCSIDPIGVHWGLRHSADGKGEGVECLILGGIHGDIPIEPTGGEVVADLVADENVNVIIDCSRNSSGAMWSIGERVRFITAFALRLFMRQGSLVDGQRREPIFLALDEAARYVPQNPRHGDKDIMFSLGAWEQLVEEGRNVGIGVGLFTQRSARLNKSVAELADTMIAFRTTGPNSIDAIVDWLGEHVPKAEQKVYIEQIRKLPVGTALVVSPGWLDFEGVVAMRARQTFDSSSTPKPGERAQRVTGSGAMVDLGAYQARMAETIERVQAEDPRTLRHQISELQRTARSRETHINDLELALQSAPAVTIDVPVLTEADRKQLVEIYEDYVEVAHSLGNIEDAFTEQSLEVLRALERVAHPAVLVTPPKPDLPNPALVRQHVETPVSRPAVPSETTVGLSKAQRAFLSALVLHGPMPDTRLGFLAGYAPGSGHFKNVLGSLRTAGLVEGARDAIKATVAGYTALGGEIDALPTGQALLDYWYAKLGKAHKAMLQALVRAYPEPMTAEELGEASGYVAGTGHFKNVLGRLRSTQLVTGDRNALMAVTTLGEASLEGVQ